MAKDKSEKKVNPIVPTQAEIYAFNVLNNTAAQAEAEFKRAIEARNSYIQLLEMKYGAKYNQQTGMFEKEEKTEEVDK